MVDSGIEVVETHVSPAKQNTKRIEIQGFRLTEQILDKISKGEGKNWPAFLARQ